MVKKENKNKCCLCPNIHASGKDRQQWKGKYMKWLLILVNARKAMGISVRAYWMGSELRWDGEGRPVCEWGIAAEL